MKYAIYGLLFILLANGLLFLFQESVTQIAVSEGIVADSFYDFAGSPLALANMGTAGNYTIANNLSLPASTGAVEESNGNFFVDAITSTINWIKSVPIIGQIINFADTLVNSIPRMLALLGVYGVPGALVFTLQAMWYLLFLFIVGLLALGR
jgi:hypothetical protein